MVLLESEASRVLLGAAVSEDKISAGYVGLRMDDFASVEASKADVSEVDQTLTPEGLELVSEVPEVATAVSVSLRNLMWVVLEGTKALLEVTTSGPRAWEVVVIAAALTEEELPSKERLSASKVCAKIETLFVIHFVSSELSSV